MPGLSVLYAKGAMPCTATHCARACEIAYENGTLSDAPLVYTAGAGR